jgi:signal transduction histidine kinase
MNSKKIKKQVKKSKNKILGLLPDFIDPIIVVNKDGCIEYFNEKAKQNLGLIDGDFGVRVCDSKKCSINKFKNVIRKEIKVDLIKRKEGGEKYNLEEVSTINGEEIYYSVRTTEIFNEKKEYVGFVKIFYDITRERIINKIKSEFISVVAHQLRTPLSITKWVIDMLLDGDAGAMTEKQKDLLSKGFKSNERMIHLVDNMLDVTRIEDGRFGYSFDYCDLQEILDIAYKEIEELVKNKILNFSIKKPDKKVKIFADKERMALVFINLFDNAVKYTPIHGNVEVEIKNDSDNLYVTIKDNGVGIPVKDFNKIFSKFFRADNVMRIETDGTGLGLFIVKNIINKHKGHIEIKSEEGKGTTASFRIPIKK